MIPESESAKIVELYQGGNTCQDIAIQYGCRDTTIRLVLLRAKVEMRPRSTENFWTEESLVSKVVEMWNEGFPAGSIATRMKLEHRKVRNILKSKGIKYEPRWQGGERHASWKGGEITATGGYKHERMAVDDPLSAMRRSDGYALQHRLVMARHLGRPLAPYEQVHHINGDKLDNSIENLQLIVGAHGVGIQMCCADCGSKNVKPCPL